MSKRHKRMTTRDSNVIQLSQALVMNGRAMEDGPRRKHWSRHDLAAIRPLTPMQEELFREFIGGQNICAYGTAGTGKTFSAVFLALNEMLQQQSPIDKIIIVRSTVPTREVGHLPGTLEEKVAIYEEPYIAVFAELLGRPTAYADMKGAGKVEFHSTSFLRSLTWDNALVIVDEAQNMAFHELNTVMTRLGTDSRIIVAGDTAQNDLHGKQSINQSGFADFIRVVERMNCFSSVKFTRHDIVRGPLVKAWIEACEDLGMM